jgi:pimeloyl-ACP methyl ester carboxylesterase
MRVPCLETADNGPLLHFAHANGYPPAAYTPLFGRLSERTHILAMHARPLWPAAMRNDDSMGDGRLDSWRLLADDLIAFCDEHKLRGAIGAGHSLGGVTTLMAAVQRPDLFDRLVLIDPVLLSRRRSAAWGLVKRLGLAAYFNPLVGPARRRQRSFASREAMFAHYRNKQVFAGLDDRALGAYVDALGRRASGGSVELTYPPEWEARIYETLPHDLWRLVPQVRCPVMVLYGERSDTFRAAAASELKRALPQAVLRCLPGAGHLVPLEKPKETTEGMIEFLGL